MTRLDPSEEISTLLESEVFILILRSEARDAEELWLISIPSPDQAGLTETLKSDGPFTVFAPTDEAFAKIPEATLQALLQDKEALANILTYHVVAEQLDATAVLSKSELHMLNGSSAKISLENGPMIENAQIIQTDIQTTNGIIHVIDTVILP